MNEIDQAEWHRNHELLHAYGLGKIGGEALDTVARHLETCVECRRIVAAAPPDRFLGHLQEVAADSGTAGGGIENRGAAGGEFRTPPSEWAAAPPGSSSGFPAVTSPSAVVTPTPAPAANSSAGDEIPVALARSPEYEVLREINRGGMGVVFLVRNRRMDRLEGLKVVHEALLQRAGAVERFEREMRSAARLNHPNIVTAYSSPPLEGLLAFAMEYVNGIDLHQLVRARGPLPVSNACYYVYQAALGLQHAHERQMVHRDIKPNNLMLTCDGKKQIIKILDFGLAKATSENSRDAGLTSEGQMLGTPRYMAPEQIASASKADIRADIYSLGCTLYYLLAGTPPFQHKDSLYEILAAHHTETAQPLNELRPDVPAELATIVAKMMAKAQADRYQTPAQVAEAMTPFFKQGIRAMSIGSALSSVDAELEESGTSRNASVGISCAPVAAIPGVVRPEQEGAIPQPPEIAELAVEAGGASLSKRLSRERMRRDAARRQALKIWGAILGGVLVVGAVALLADTVFKVKTPEGILVVKVAQSDAEVIIDGRGAEVKWSGGEKGGKQATIHVRPGERRVEVRRGGITIAAKTLTLVDGKEEVFEASLEQEEPLAEKSAPVNATRPAPAPSAALLAFQRGRIPADALSLAGNGDPARAPAELVGALGEASPIHNDLIRSVAFSPDGRWLASGSFDKTILLWDAATGRPRRSWRGHNGWITAVAFSSDSQTVVSASADGTLKFWSVQQEAEPRTMQPELGVLWGMDVSRDGRFLCAGGTSGKIKLWKWDAWETPVELPTIVGEVFLHFNGNRNAALTFSPDGGLLAVSGGGSFIPQNSDDKPAIPIWIYQTADGKLVQTLPGHNQGMRSAQGLAFSHDGKFLASIVQDDQAKVWELASGKPVSGGFARQQFGTVTFGPDDKTLLIGGSINGIHVHDVLSGARDRGLYAGHAHNWDVALSPNGKLVATGFYTGSVHFWDTDDWQELYLERGHRHCVRALAFTPDGGALLSAGDDGTFRRWDLAQPDQNQIVRRFNSNDIHANGSPAGSVSIAVNPVNGSMAVVTRGTDSATCRVTVWKGPPMTEMFHISQMPDSILFSPDGTALAGGCEDGNVRLWDAEHGTELHRFALAGRSTALAFSPDGRLLAAASYDKNLVKLWNVASEVEIQAWHDAPIFAAAFHPDGQTLATGHGDGSITLRDPATGGMNRVLRGHSARIRALKFAPDSQTLISSADDGTMRVWNANDDLPRQVIPLGPANSPLLFDLDSSGKFVAAGGAGPVIFLLRIPAD